MQIRKFNFQIVAPAHTDTRYAYYHPEDEKEDQCLTTSKSMEVVIRIEVNDRTYGQRQVIRRNDIESCMEQLIRHAYYKFRDVIEKESQ